MFRLNFGEINEKNWEYFYKRLAAFDVDVDNEEKRDSVSREDLKEFFGEYPEFYSLQDFFILADLLHIVFTIFALACVGYITFLFNGGLTAFAYSCHLTMKKGCMFVYLLLLVGACIWEVNGLINPDKIQA